MSLLRTQLTAYKVWIKQGFIEIQRIGFSFVLFKQSAVLLRLYAIPRSVIVLTK